MLGRVSLNPLVHVDLDRHGAVPAVAMRQRASADRLGEAGAGQHQPAAAPAPRLHARRGGRAGQQPAAGRRRRRRSVSCCRRRRRRPTARLRGAAAIARLTSTCSSRSSTCSDSAARRRQRAGRPAAARRAAACSIRLRPYGFIVLYALMLTGVLERPDRAAAPRLLSMRLLLTRETTRRLGHAPDGQAAPRAPRRRARATGSRCRTQYDCFYFVADWHALTSDYADTAEHRRQRATTTSPTGLAPARSRAQHALRAVARARARRAVPAAVDGRCRSRGSSACRPTRNRSSSSTEKDLSTLGFLGYPLLQTADVIIYNAQLRAGRRGPGAAPRARARSCAASTISTASCSSSRSRC